MIRSSGVPAALRGTSPGIKLVPRGDGRAGVTETFPDISFTKAEPLPTIDYDLKLVHRVGLFVA